MTRDFLPDGFQRFLAKYTSWKSVGVIALVVIGLIAFFVEFVGRLITTAVDWAIDHPFESIVIFWLVVLTICVVTLGQRFREEYPESHAKAVLAPPPPPPPAINLEDLSGEECFLLGKISGAGSHLGVKDTYRALLEDSGFGLEELTFGGLLHLIETLQTREFVWLSYDQKNWKATEKGRKFYFQNKEACDRKAVNPSQWKGFTLS